MEAASGPVRLTPVAAADRLPVAPRTIALGAMGLGFVVGVALAVGLTKGVALLFGLLYIPLALLNLPMAIVLWVPVLFLAQANLLSRTPQVIIIILVLAWVGGLGGRSTEAKLLLRRHAGTLIPVALLALWVTLSASWAPDPGLVTKSVREWLIAPASFLIVITTIASPKHIRWVVLAFVVGAVASVVLGLVDPPASTDSASMAAADDQQRLAGAAGDPNFLAAGCVPAILLATAMLRRKTPFMNIALVVAAALLTYGFAATQSRGGLIAAGVSVIVGLILFRGRRTQVMIFLAILVSVGAVFFSANPHALQRITNFDSNGSGRTNLWKVADRMWQDNPVVGVGLDNFQSQAKRYTQRPGKLDRVDQIVDQPHVAHNTYLQFLAETGIVGLVLFLTILVACFAGALRAARRFERRGDGWFAHLARSVAVAQLAFAIAYFFVSGGEDVRLWLLLALGPILLALSERGPEPAAEAVPPPPALRALPVP